MAANETLQDIKSKGILWGFGVFISHCSGYSDLSGRLVGQ